MRKTIEAGIAAAFLISMAVAGYTAAGRNTKRPVYTESELVHIRAFCVSYYVWRSQQAQQHGVSSVDQLCFDTTETLP